MSNTATHLGIPTGVDGASGWSGYSGYSTPNPWFMLGYTWYIADAEFGSQYYSYGYLPPRFIYVPKNKIFQIYSWATTIAHDIYDNSASSGFNITININGVNGQTFSATRGSILSAKFNTALINPSVFLTGGENGTIHSISLGFDSTGSKDLRNLTATIFIKHT